MFVNLDMKNAFSSDALVTSHPILLPVNHPDEINEIFDSISYNKVNSFAKMIRCNLFESSYLKEIWCLLYHAAVPCPTEIIHTKNSHQNFLLVRTFTIKSNPIL